MGTCQDWIMAIFMLVKGQWNGYQKKVRQTFLR